MSREPNDDFVSRSEFDRLKADLEQAYQAIEELTDTKTAMQAELAEAKATATEAETLRGSLRSMKAEASFADIAKKLGVREDAIKDVFKLLDYKADKDDPDLDAMEKSLGEALKTREYFKAEPKSPTRLTKSEGHDRGDSKEVNNRPKITRQQAADPEFMFRNQDKLAKAVAEGLMPELV